MAASAEAIEAVRPYAFRLLAILATLSVVLTFALGALRRDFDVIGTLVTKILFVGLIYWLIDTWPELLTSLIDGAVFLGTAAGGADDSPILILQPLSIVTWGWDFAQLCFRRAADLTGPVSFFTNFPLIALLFLCGIVVAFAYLMVGITIAVALVEFWVGSAAALILLPFAVFKALNFVAQSMFGWVAANAIRLLLLATIVTIGRRAFDLVALFEPAVDEVDAEHAFSGVTVAVFLLALTVSAQRMAAGLISGSPQLGGGAVFAPAIAATVASAPVVRPVAGLAGKAIGAGVSKLSGSGGRRDATAPSDSKASENVSNAANAQTNGQKS
ncbi:MAG: type IV secretion system protein [Geminicoccaceae bacterium]